MIFNFEHYKVLNKVNKTAFHIACEKNHGEIVQLLLSHPQLDVNQSMIVKMLI